MLRKRKGKPLRLNRIFQKYDPTLYFVTFNTHLRRHLLASPIPHAAFVDHCQRAYQHGIGVGRYVIMPDHLHLFVCGPDDFELGRWIGVLKKTSQSKSSIQERNRQSGSGVFRSSSAQR